MKNFPPPTSVVCDSWMLVKENPDRKKKIWECVKVLMNIFTAKIRGHVVMQHLESLHSLHSLPLLSTFYLLKKNCTHHVLFCKMTISIIINEGQKITKFFDLSLRIFEEIIVIRLGRFLLIFLNSCFGKTINNGGGFHFLPCKIELFHCL